MHDIHVQIQIDNTTAVAYINNMGGSKSVELNQLAFSVWEWCITRNVWLSAVHIAGILNTGADEKSREFSDRHEWKVNELEFGKIVSRHPNLNIHMFASRLNNKLSTYCAWKADPGSTYTDEFSVDWNNHNFQSSAKMPTKNFTTQSHGSSDCPVLADTNLVSRPAVVPSGTAMGHPTEQRSAEASLTQPTTSPAQDALPNGMSCIREYVRRMQIPADVT